MLAANRIRADAFDLGANPESGTVSPSDVVRLHTMIGYMPATWSEARSQLHYTRGLMGAIMGVIHPIITANGHFLRKYDHMITRLESEVDQVHGGRLGPAWAQPYSHFMCIWPRGTG
jgi:hypothetical protein